MTTFIITVVAGLLLLAQHLHLRARLAAIAAAHGIIQEQLTAARDDIATITAMLAPAIAQLPKTRAKRAAN